MPGSEVILDTNAFIALVGEDKALLTRMSEFKSFYIPLTVLGELEFGAAKSARPEENRATLDALMKSFQLLIGNQDTARLYGKIFFELRKNGRPIPTNDVWIAAVAIQYSLPLITRDLHFSYVSGLNAITW